MERQPLGETSGNRRGPELTLYQRGKLVGLRNAGKSWSQINAETGVPISTIRNTVRLAPQRDQGKSLPRSGRPTIVTSQLERHLVRIINDTPKIPYKTLLRQYRLNISRTTIYRILRKHNVIKWRCKKRPFISRKTAAIRFAYAREYRHKKRNSGGRFSFAMSAPSNKALDTRQSGVSVLQAPQSGKPRIFRLTGLARASGVWFGVASRTKRGVLGSFR